MTEARVVNGVNVVAVNELVKNVESDPKLGGCKFHIKNTWSTCGQNQSKVSSFYGAKQEIPHDGPFILNSDEPAFWPDMIPVRIPSSTCYMRWQDA